MQPCVVCGTRHASQLLCQSSVIHISITMKYPIIGLVLLQLGVCLDLEAPSLRASSKFLNDIPPIIIKGKRFFYSNNGTQFFMKGIAYQQTSNSKLTETRKNEILTTQIASVARQALVEESDKYHDPLADEIGCLRDIPHLIDLSVNLVRVYSINPLANHDVCMNALAKAGIYVISDLAEPSTSVDRNSPYWTTELLDRYKNVIDSLAKYNNLLGFFAGNEVTNDKSNTQASSFIKAAVRDSKNYIDEKKYRKIPVGYSSNDDAETRMNLIDFFTCESEYSDNSTVVDFYGINMYEWCGYASFFSSGYSERTIDFQNYSVPVFFSEFGCNLVRPRPFQEVEALYSPLMTNVWSGGIAYMYFEEDNRYGVVSLDQEKNLIKKLDDYRYLRDAYKNASPRLSNAQDYNPLVQASPKCPQISQVWKASSSLPQTPNNFKCECLEASLECIVSPNKKVHNFEKLYEFLCAEVDCSEISVNASDGVYGYYSDCDNKQKLSYIINKYYLKTNRDPQSCDFKGEAFLNTDSFSNQDLSSISKHGKTCSEVLADFSTNDSPKKSKSKSKGIGTGTETDEKDTQISAAPPQLKLSLTAAVVLIMFWFPSELLRNRHY